MDWQTGNKVKPVFDYGSITDEHKTVASEIVNLLDNMNLPMASELIKQKFQLVETPKYDISQSKFVKECDKVGIHCAVQGWIKEGNEKEYQVISVTEDVRRLNDLIDSIKNS